MLGENTGKIMPADCVRPCVDNRLDLTFGRSALPHHGSCSDCLPRDVPEDERRGADPTRRIIFHAGAPGDLATAAPGRSSTPATAVALAIPRAGASQSLCAVILPLSVFTRATWNLIGSVASTGQIRVRAYWGVPERRATNRLR